MYEDKIDNVIRKKYPKTVKILSRIANILSEFMIIIILMVQLLVLTIVAPISLLMWVLNILTLLLQTTVINTTGEDAKHYAKCIRYCKILRIYSACLITV
jgi:hypothetical protein